MCNYKGIWRLADARPQGPQLSRPNPDLGEFRNDLYPSGISGRCSLSLGLHAGHGAPAPPHWHASDSRFRASELIEQSLNGRTPTAYDEDADGNRIVNQPETIAAREKQQRLKDRFRDWFGKIANARRGWRKNTTSGSTTFGSSPECDRLRSGLRLSRPPRHVQ
jgi:hypothetical protein